MPVSRRRVLLLNAGYQATGADRAARELFERLPSLGWDAELWVGAGPVPPISGVHVVPWKAEHLLAPLDAFWPHNDWRHVGSRWKLSRLEADSFDLIHVHCTMGRWLSIRALAALAARMPLVWTMHDEWAISGGLVADLGPLLNPRDIPGLPPAWKPQMRLHHGWRTVPIRAALQRWRVPAAALVAPSRHIAEKARRTSWLQGVPVHVVRNGVTMAEEPAARMARDVARMSWGLALDRPVVLMIAGSLGEPIKGVRFGFDSLAWLPRQLGVQVLLVGNGADEVLPDASVGLRVVSVGPARGLAALARAYRAADITLIPSLMENLPYVGMESLACQTPFVSFDVGGFCEIAESGGALTVPHYDTFAMAQSIATLLVDPDRRRRMGMAGHEWVNSSASMPGYLSGIDDLYDHVKTMRSRIYTHE